MANPNIVGVTTILGNTSSISANTGNGVQSTVLVNNPASSSEVYMILSEDCDIQRIRVIAKEKAFLLEEVKRRRKWNEWNYIFKIKTTRMYHEHST